MFVSTYSSCSERYETERKVLWNDLDECMKSFEVNVSIVLLVDLNACTVEPATPVV